MKPKVIGTVLLAMLASACGSAAAVDTTMETTTTSLAIPETRVTTTTAALAETTPTNRIPVPPTTTTPPLPTTTTQPPPPTYAYSISPVTRETVPYTWREGCPLHWEELSLIRMTYWNFDGNAVTGEMVINSSVAEDVVAAFEKLFAMKFPIEKLALVDEYQGDDKAAMAANVTSGFNCRYVDGTERWSNHAFGLAIDINPLINPWARPDNALPIAGTKYAEDREEAVPGMINLGDRIIDVFADLGWSWGGVWTAADYMHFSQPGN